MKRVVSVLAVLPVETTIRLLIERKQIQRIEIATHDGKTFTAIAYPTSWHPIVKTRRDAALTDKTEFTLAEVSTIDQATHQALCRASGPTLLDAVERLVMLVRKEQFE